MKLNDYETIFAMILEAAIINLTRNLDIICQKDGQGVSSHVQLKEEGLICLLELIEKAPVIEYNKLLEAENHEILIGYLLNVLCHLAKNDKSKSIKVKALNVILSLTSRLESMHDISGKSCSINILVSALPGVSSSLFRILMSDTKLPKNLLVVAGRALRKFIYTVFLPCEHKVVKTNSFLLEGENLKDVCDNLASRFELLFEHVMTYSTSLAPEFKYEMLNLCETVVCKTRIELLNRSLKSVVKYIAFASSTSDGSKPIEREVQNRIALIADYIKDQIKESGSDSDSLESMVLKCISKLLDDLENNCLTMLPAERHSELTMLYGFLKLLPPDSLTTFIEVNERRSQLLNVFMQLTEFKTSQPFLFLTGAQVNDQALESCTEKIYTVEKRFSHINDKELKLVMGCSELIGRDLSWPCLNDMIMNELRKFPIPNNLFITHLILIGCIQRNDLNSNKSRFTRRVIEYYIEHAHESYLTFNDLIQRDKAINSHSILAVVIAIETLVSLVKMHMKFSGSEAEKVVVLKDLLCPLLNWASSNSRAVSEASLNALTSISLLNGNGSTKALIEANIDYIVDGVMHLMDNFVHNSDVTNVLALTFKLSSIDSFYYFKDVYERVFKILAVYHHTDKSKPIALLFYRTLAILDEWRKAKGQTKDQEDVPLKSEASIKSVILDLDIDWRLEKLNASIEKAREYRRQLDNTRVDEDDERQTIKELNQDDFKRSNQVDSNPAMEAEDEPKKQKSNDVILAEKILKHCVNLISSSNSETKILALKTAACGFRVLLDDEDTLLPLVHQIWSPLVSRLTDDYRQNLEINLAAFECLVSMASCAKDFIMKRTLDNIIPRLCLFLESQANESRCKKEYGPYCMTVAYKCQLRILTHLGALSFHIQLAYSNLWRVIRASLIYLDCKQVPSLREAARTSLNYMMALDADCVWYFAKQNDQVSELPFEAIYEATK